MLQGGSKRKAGLQCVPIDPLRTSQKFFPQVSGAAAAAFIYVHLAEGTCVSRPVVTNITVQHKVFKITVNIAEDTLTMESTMGRLYSATCIGPYLVSEPQVKQ